MRKRGLSAFEESRRALKNIFMKITEWKKKPKIVDFRTRGLDEEVTYKSLLQDLYLSSLEDDPKDRRSYQEQLEEFNEWYSKLDPGLDHYLVERMILREGYSNLSEKEAEELRDRYDDGIKNFAIRGIIEKAIEIVKQGCISDDVCEKR